MKAFIFQFLLMSSFSLLPVTELFSASIPKAIQGHWGIATDGKPILSVNSNKISEAGIAMNCIFKSLQKRGNLYIITGELNDSGMPKQIRKCSFKLKKAKNGIWYKKKLLLHWSIEKAEVINDQIPQRFWGDWGKDEVSGSPLVTISDRIVQNHQEQQMGCETTKIRVHEGSFTIRCTLKDETMPKALRYRKFILKLKKMKLSFDNAGKVQILKKYMH